MQFPRKPEVVERHFLLESVSARRVNRFFKLRRLDLVTIRRKDTDEKFDVLVYYINIKDKKVTFRAHSPHEEGSKFIECHFMRNRIVDKANGGIITILKGTNRFANKR